MDECMNVYPYAYRLVWTYREWASGWGYVYGIYKFIRVYNIVYSNKHVGGIKKSNSQTEFSMEGL